MLLGTAVHHASAQTSSAVQGNVVDTETGETIPGAHAFLASTSIGDITDANGQFTIEGIPAGSYQLLASMIGYKSLQQSIELQPGRTLTLTIRLEKDVYEVGQITVEDRRPRGWRRNFNRFERVFLGNTPNRRGCEIQNPYVLDFKREGNTLAASASAPLVIENRSLGYKVTYLLTDFQSKFGAYRYQGEHFFEPLEPSNEKELERWKGRRAEAYEGSFQHFLRSLVAGAAYEDGFRMYLVDRLIWNLREREFLDAVHEFDAEITPDSFVVASVYPYERQLRFNGYLHVQYLDQTMLSEFYDTHLKYGMKKEAIRAAIELFEGRATFNELGFLKNAYQVGRHGYWSWESGVCNLLPHGYEWVAAD